MMMSSDKKTKCFTLSKFGLWRVGIESGALNGSTGCRGQPC